MNFDQVMALVNAGFTKEDILAMQGGQPEPAQPEPTQPAAQPDPAPAQPAQTQAAAQPDPAPSQPAQTQAAAPEASSQANGDDAYSRLEAKLNQLIGLQTQANINANVGSAQPARSATDILAGVIAPPRREGRQEGKK